LNGIVNIIRLVDKGYSLIASTLKAQAIVWEKTTEGTGLFSFLSPAGTILRAGCFTLEEAPKTLFSWIEYVQMPMQIMACDPKGTETLEKVFEADFQKHWYFGFQKFALNLYNTASGRAITNPATSLYENLYTSIIGLCVPGLIYNAKKASEIKCRQFICYGKDVPAGIATITSCNELHALQMCEYVLGPALQFFPFIGIASYIGGLLKSVISSPIGLVFTVAEVAPCALLCFDPTTSPGAESVCKFVKGTNNFLAIVDGFVSVVKFRPDVTETKFCDEAKEIEVEDLITSGEEEESEESVLPTEEVQEV